MKQQTQNSSQTDEKTARPNGGAAHDPDSWEALYARIRVLAARRAEGMIYEDDETDAFDRGARALRTLMSAALVARRMKSEDAKDAELNDEQAAERPIADEDIQKIYRSVAASVARCEDESDAAARSHQAINRNAVSGIGSDDLGAECA
ncbi:MAG: hypothetical protein AAGC77_04530 [Pseudomonadota bacterium]